jgi:hypothetical protein
MLSDEKKEKRRERRRKTRQQRQRNKKEHIYVVQPQKYNTMEEAMRDINIPDGLGE